MRATRSPRSTGSSFSRCALTRSLIWQCRHSAIGHLFLAQIYFSAMVARGPRLRMGATAPEEQKFADEVFSAVASDVLSVKGMGHDAVEVGIDLSGHLDRRRRLRIH